MAQTTIFVIDDHPLMRGALRRAAETTEDLLWIGEAETAAGSLAGLAERIPDVVVLDIGLPDRDGVDLCREITTRYPETRVLVLSGLEDDWTVTGAMAAGASGFVGKNEPVAELVRALRSLPSSGFYLSRARSEGVLQAIQSDDADAGPDLSLGEERVLEELARGASNRQIADRLGYHEQTVKNYVSSLFKKLGVQSRLQAALLLNNRRLRRRY